jgi:hypothetical protein
VKLPPSEADIDSDDGIEALIANIKKGGTETDRQKTFETAIRNPDLLLIASQVGTYGGPSSLQPPVHSVQQKQWYLVSFDSRHCIANIKKGGAEDGTAKDL